MKLCEFHVNDDISSLTIKICIDTYQVTFYGDSSYYVDAANCEIEDYIKSSNCYCSTNGGSDCVDFNFFLSCGLLLDNSYQSKLQASYIIAIISIVIVAAYAFQTCLLICCPYEYVDNTRGDAAVPTTATVQPSIETQNTDQIAMAVVTIAAHHEDFHNETVVSGRFNPGKSSVREVTAELVPVDVSINVRNVVTSTRSINDIH